MADRIAFSPPSETQVYLAGNVYGKYVYPEVINADADYSDLNSGAYSQSFANMTTVNESVVAEMSQATADAQSQPEFWATFQQLGNRTDYSYAFVNWSADKIVPMYAIGNVDKCMYALMNCTNLVNAGNLVFTITQQTPNMQYVCANCINMTRAPQFVFPNTAIVRTYASIYASCAKLTNAEIYFGSGVETLTNEDGTTTTQAIDLVKNRTSCQNMFFKCSELQEVYWGSPNLASPIYLDLSYCEKLSVASYERLATALFDVAAYFEELSQSPTGIYQIKVPASFENNAAYTSALNAIIAKGWTPVYEAHEETPTPTEGGDAT